MAETKELTDVLVEQIWEAVRAFMNQKPDDVTHENLELAAAKMGVTITDAEFSIVMAQAATIPPWSELGPTARHIWWEEIVWQFMPHIAGLIGEVERIDIEERN